MSRREQSAEPPPAGGGPAQPARSAPAVQQQRRSGSAGCNPGGGEECDASSPPLRQQPPPPPLHPRRSLPCTPPRPASPRKSHTSPACRARCLRPRQRRRRRRRRQQHRQAPGRLGGWRWLHPEAPLQGGGTGGRGRGQASVVPRKPGAWSSHFSEPKTNVGKRQALGQAQGQAAAGACGEAAPAAPAGMPLPGQPACLPARLHYCPASHVPVRRARVGAQRPCISCVTRSAECTNLHPWGARGKGEG